MTDDEIMATVLGGGTSEEGVPGPPPLIDQAALDLAKVQLEAAGGFPPVRVTVKGPLTSDVMAKLGGPGGVIRMSARDYADLRRPGARDHLEIEVHAKFLRQGFFGRVGKAPVFVSREQPVGEILIVGDAPGSLVVRVVRPEVSDDPRNRPQ